MNQRGEGRERAGQGKRRRMREREKEIERWGRDKNRRWGCRGTGRI